MGPTLSPELRPLPLPFTPIPYLLGFTFLCLAPVHQDVPWVESLHGELLLVAFAMATAVIGARSAERSPSAKAFASFCLLLATAPLLSSLANHGELAVFQDPEYRSWLKTLLLLPLFYLFFAGRRSAWLLETVFLATFVLALIFLYRFFALHEVREFDGRPLLNIKNGDPNFLCVLFATPVPLLLGRAAAARGIRRAFAWGLFALLVFCALITESRMGLISLAGTAIYLGLTGAKPRQSLLAAVLVAPLAFLYGGVSDRFLHVADVSNRLRWQSWRAGLELFTESPLWGKGWGHGASAFYRVAGYPRFQSETPPLNVHNTALQVLAELGLVGVLCYAALFLFVAREIRRNSAPAARYSAAALMILAFNAMTLPLEGKDFLVLWLGILAAVNFSARPVSKC